MVRPALSATRGLDILDFMAGFPGRGFTLSEVMRATGINAASCHAILNALAERGYVQRCPDSKQFRLGAVAIALGDAALAAQPLIARARATARELAATLDVPVLLSAGIGDEIVGILALADSRGRVPSLKIGERRAMIPPVGAPFVAWEGDTAIDRWLARAPGADAGHMRHNVELIRQRGYQVALRSPDAPRLALEIEDMATARKPMLYKDRMAGAVGALANIPLAETVEPDTLYDVILIAAPVFDKTGAAVYNLCLGDFTERLNGQRILDYADHLLAACLQIMQG